MVTFHLLLFQRRYDKHNTNHPSGGNSASRQKSGLAPYNCSVGMKLLVNSMIVSKPIN